MGIVLWTLDSRRLGMTLMQVALTLSIIASTLAIVASFCGFVRFVRKSLRRGTDELVSQRPGQRNQ